MSSFREVRDAITGTSWLDDIARKSLVAAEEKFEGRQGQVIRTVADLDALPVGTILKNGARLSLWYRHDAGWLHITPVGMPSWWEWNEGHLPVEVVWVPGGME